MFTRRIGRYPAGTGKKSWRGGGESRSRNDTWELSPKLKLPDSELSSMFAKLAPVLLLLSLLAKLSKLVAISSEPSAP